MRQLILHLSKLLAGLSSLMLLAGTAAQAQIAAPGDICYSVHCVQKFQYYAFSTDIVPWEDFTDDGTSLSARRRTTRRKRGVRSGSRARTRERTDSSPLTSIRTCTCRRARASTTCSRTS